MKFYSEIYGFKSLTGTYSKHLCGSVFLFYTMGLNTSEGKSVNDSRPPVLIVAEFYYSV